MDSSHKRLKVGTNTVEKGRQRLHGAFTGGFSAGYYNTVGSKEGFQPTSFISSRNQRAEIKKQSLASFLDKEDDDIAGQGKLQISTQYSDKTHSDTRKQQQTGGMLDLLFSNTSLRSIGNRLLQLMGWKPGQGVGAFQKLKVESNSLDVSKIPTTALSSDGYIKLAPKEELVTLIPNSNISNTGLDYSNNQSVEVSSLISKPLPSSNRYHMNAIHEFEIEEEYDTVAFEDEQLKEINENLKRYTNSTKLPVFMLATTSAMPEMSDFDSIVAPSDFILKHKVKNDCKNPPLAFLDDVTRNHIMSVVNQHNKKQTESEKIKQTNLAAYEAMAHALKGRFVNSSGKEHLPIPTSTKEIEKQESFPIESTSLKKSRVTTSWFPSKLLCKRYNIAEPTNSLPMESSLKQATSVEFEHEKNNRINMNEMSLISTNAILESGIDNSNSLFMLPPKPEISLFKSIFVDSSDDEEEINIEDDKDDNEQSLLFEIQDTFKQCES